MSEHDHHHDHEEGGHHHHEEGSDPLDRLVHAVPFLHAHGERSVDEALESSAQGLRALKLSLVGLGVTAAFQLAIVAASGSVGLLADSVHNVADALTAYLDGQSLGTQRLGIALNTLLDNSGLVLGRESWCGCDYFYGSLDEGQKRRFIQYLRSDRDEERDIMRDDRMRSR